MRTRPYSLVSRPTWRPTSSAHDPLARAMARHRAVRLAETAEPIATEAGATSEPAAPVTSDLDAPPARHGEGDA